jgi:tetraacyldisaccharide 4'-kinase
MKLLPRGPWREPPASARRATLLAVTRRAAPAEAAERTAQALRAIAPGLPVVRLELRPGGWLRAGEPAAPPVQPALAVAAVADPSSFLDNARSAGAVLHGSLIWRDHHGYGAADAARIKATAGDGPVVTTEKDWVKLERLLPAEQVWVLRQEVMVEAGEEALRAALDRVLGA